LAQFADAKECLRLLGFHTLEMEGYEADDILGTVAAMGEAEGDTHTYVLSGDRDLLQLISDKTTVLIASTGETVPFDRNAFFAKYGIEPSEFVQLKALMGDSSDHIYGVPGIGEKTAVNHLQMLKN
jgi:DNA polymerase-1